MKTLALLRHIATPVSGKATDGLLVPSADATDLPDPQLSGLLLAEFGHRVIRRDELLALHGGKPTPARTGLWGVNPYIFLSDNRLRTRNRESSRWYVHCFFWLPPAPSTKRAADGEKDEQPAR